MSRIVSRRFIVLFVVAFGAVACARNRTVPATHDEATTPTQGTSANNSGAGSGEPVRCGAATCARGQVCCNASCGICTDPGGMCTQQLCEASPDAATAPTPAPGATCASDSDCRTFSDYCTGCNCRALARTAPDPTCSGPGVRCLADPCMRHTAACDPATHACVLR